MDLKALNQRYETITWGALFILIGILSLVPGIPPGAGTLSIGVILLGLNGMRSVKEIPINMFSLTLGVVASILGAAVLIGSLSGYKMDGPLFPAILIAIGIYWIILARMAKPLKNND